jgi:alpha-tubulin suppressor-like RCC1 family protein
LGNETANYIDTPVQVSGLSGITAISAGDGQSLALESDGTVWDWGMDMFGELGNGTVTSIISSPVQATGLSGVVAIAAGNNQSFALKSDGTVWAWGLNDDGQLGNGTTTDSATPVQVSGLTGCVSIAAGVEFSLAIQK